MKRAVASAADECRDDDRLNALLAACAAAAPRRVRFRQEDIAAHDERSSRARARAYDAVKVRSREADAEEQEADQAAVKLQKKTRDTVAAARRELGASVFTPSHGRAAREGSQTSQFAATTTTEIAGYSVAGSASLDYDLAGRLVLPPAHFAAIALASDAAINVATEVLPPVLEITPASFSFRPTQRVVAPAQVARDPACAALLAHAERLLAQQQANIVQTNIALLRVANARAILQSANQLQLAQLPSHVVDQVLDAQRFIFTMQSHVQQLTVQQDVIRAQLLHTQQVISMIAQTRARA